MASADTCNWRQVLPTLEKSVDDLTRNLLDAASLISLAKNSTVFRQGDACNNYLIILSGRVKVFTRTVNGREIVLYRLSAGDSCVLTTSCLFGNKHYPAEGKTESDVMALAIPAMQFNRVLKQSEAFREMVFSAFSSHITDLITLVEEITFGRLDIRLARYLLNQCDDKQTLITTHQIIAAELGSAREVISRLLKDLESKGCISTARGYINIKNREALQSIAES